MRSPICGFIASGTPHHPFLSILESENFHHLFSFIFLCFCLTLWLRLKWINLYKCQLEADSDRSTDISSADMAAKHCHWTAININKTATVVYVPKCKTFKLKRKNSSTSKTCIDNIQREIVDKSHALTEQYGESVATTKRMRQPTYYGLWQLKVTGRSLSAGILHKTWSFSCKLRTLRTFCAFPRFYCTSEQATSSAYICCINWCITCSE